MARENVVDIRTVVLELSCSRVREHAQSAIQVYDAQRQSISSHGVRNADPLPADQTLRPARSGRGSAACAVCRRKWLARRSARGVHPWRPGCWLRRQSRCYFDPNLYRIITFDQRGCGRSTPHASLENNTTWHLVEDLERIREHLGIDKWVLFGGSWGSTLALAYAQTHPERVHGLILRGIFLCRPQEIEWFYQEGASRLFPDYWQDYIAPIPPEERGDLVKAFHKRLTGNDQIAQMHAAKAWSTWEAVPPPCARTRWWSTASPSRSGRCRLRVSSATTS